MSRAYIVKVSGSAVLTAMTVLLAALVIASPAGAAPKGIFGVFGGCPVSELKGRSENSLCVYAQIAGGVLRVGRATVPIARTITMQAGGVPIGEEDLVGWDMVPPSGGTIMSKTPLEVPGGLGGVVQCAAIGGHVAEVSCGAAEGSEVTATIEVVPGSSDPAVIYLDGVSGNEPLVVLPTRVHLGNVFLGSSCYLGSGSHPIMLEMTFGTTNPPAPNKPISGYNVGLQFEEENGVGLLALGGSVLVDSEFSVPVAEGCGGQLSSLVDPVLDAKLGLPSTAGHNTAILDARALDLAGIEAVIDSEG